MITRHQIQILFDKYFELVKLEVEEFGIKPTEVRHLIGRLGEFYCALQVEGSLARTANQHGFDVISKAGRKISVKTTAQKTGFVPISSNTIRLGDDLMILQYLDGKISMVYFGPVEVATKEARFYESVKKYELDISKARRLKSY